MIEAADMGIGSKIHQIAQRQVIAAVQQTATSSRAPKRSASNRATAAVGPPIRASVFRSGTREMLQRNG